MHEHASLAPVHPQLQRATVRSHLAKERADPAPSKGSRVPLDMA
jgi:hypothetical protein